MKRREGSVKRDWESNALRWQVDVILFFLSALTNIVELSIEREEVRLEMRREKIEWMEKIETRKIEKEFTVVRTIFELVREISLLTRKNERFYCR